MFPVPLPLSSYLLLWVGGPTIHLGESHNTTMMRRAAQPRAMLRAVHPVGVARRHNAYIGDVTKGNMHMSHLDLYARRDPQLAPYLLREVDIEFKRKCRKVNFIFWVALCVCGMMIDQRSHAEVVYFVRHYAELIQEERDARDLDNDLRRAKLVGVMGVVKAAFDRDAKWTLSDHNDAIKILQSSDLDKSQGRQQPAAA